MAVAKKPSRTTKIDFYDSSGWFCRLRKAGMDILEPNSSIAESFRVLCTIVHAFVKSFEANANPLHRSNDDDLQVVAKHVFTEVFLLFFEQNVFDLKNPNVQKRQTVFSSHTLNFNSN